MKNKILLLFISVLMNFSCGDINNTNQGTFKGRVIDSFTKEGLADIELILDPQLASNGNTKSDSHGSFKLARIEEGVYKVNVTKAGASILDSKQDVITITDNVVVDKVYELAPRVSIYDLSVDYDATDKTKFTVRFKVKGNSGNKLNYFSVMWNNYPQFVFGDLPSNQKKAIKHSSVEHAEITYEMKGLSLKSNTDYYIRVGVTHLPNGGDYNHSKVILIRFA
ncbi:MAG: carboxypeptidase-like regulatory domain-containing protein [Bacteroidales bacterium]